ncbi:ABC transporter permease [Williamsia sp. SKLECPSW1]
MVVPAVVLVVLVVVVALATAILQSLGLMPLVGSPALSVDGYTSAWPELLTSVRVSVGIAAVSTVLAVIIGVAAALAVAAASRSVLAAGTITVPVPHLVGAATIGLLLADSGLLARLFGISGAESLGLVGGRWWIAVIAEYTWKESAFIALVVGGTLASRVAGYDETAALLGAGRRARFRFVTLPLIAPSVVAASAITFTYALGSYEVAMLLGRPYPEPMAVMAVRLFRSIDLSARPEAAAVSVVTAGLSLLVIGLALAALRRLTVWR